MKNPIANIRGLILRAQVLLGWEGFASIMTRTLKVASRFVYGRELFLVYEHDLDNIEEPSHPGSIFKFIESYDDIEWLVASGALLPMYYELAHLRRHLSSNNFALLAISKSRIAHWSWVAISKDASIDRMSRLFVGDGVGYIGRCMTKSAFRGQGYYPAALAAICKWLKNHNYREAILTVSESNTSSIRGVLKAGFRPTGESIIARSSLGRKHMSSIVFRNREE